MATANPLQAGGADTGPNVSRASEVSAVDSQAPNRHYEDEEDEWNEEAQDNHVRSLYKVITL